MKKKGKKGIVVGGDKTWSQEPAGTNWDMTIFDYPEGEQDFTLTFNKVPKNCDEITIKLRRNGKPYTRQKEVERQDYNISNIEKFWEDNPNAVSDILDELPGKKLKGEFVGTLDP